MRYLLSGLTVALLSVVSFVVAVAGTFMHRWASPFGLLLAVGAAAGVCVLAGQAVRSRIGIGVVALAWLVPVLVMAQPRAEGDVVIAGDATGLLFLFGGVVSIGVTVGLGVARVK